MTTNPEQLCGIPSNLCVLFRPVHSPALPIPCCISSLLKPLIVLPHQRRAWFLFCWENWSNAKKISNNIHHIYLTMWLCTYLICLSVHLPTYLLSIYLSIHPSFFSSSVLFFLVQQMNCHSYPGILSTFHASSHASLFHSVMAFQAGGSSYHGSMWEHPFLDDLNKPSTVTHQWMEWRSAAQVMSSLQLPDGGPWFSRQATGGMNFSLQRS